MPTLRLVIPAALAAAALPAPPVAAAPRPMRVIVADLEILGVPGQTRASAIRFLRSELTAFLADTSGKRGWPQIYFQSVEADSEESTLPTGDFATWRQHPAWKKEDVLAYIFDGSVAPGRTPTPVVVYTIVLRPPGPTRQFVRAKSKFPEGTREGISYEHKFVIAYAIIVQSYLAGHFDVAATLAARVTDFVEAAKNSWGPTYCVVELADAIREIGLKAGERALPGATDTGVGVLPPSRLPQEVICTRS